MRPENNVIHSAPRGHNGELRRKDELKALTERDFDLSVDLLCLAGVDGYFKVLNSSWERTLGWSSDELMSRPYLDFVHPDDRDATAVEAAKLAAGFQSVHFRNRYRCRDGSYRWLAWTATPALANGTIYAGARDVTSAVLAEEQRHALLREQLARVRTAVEGSAMVLVFQPIVDLRGHAVRGLEALARFNGRPRRLAQRWFAEADAVGLRTELELRAIHEAVSRLSRLPAGLFLSINASPATLLTDEFALLVNHVDGRRLLIEVTEHAAVDDYDQLKKAIGRLRGSGVRLAIDDAGAGFSSLSHIVRLVPDFIKLDLFLTRDIDTDPVKRSLCAAMVAFASDIGASLIAEGVETQSELGTIEALGIEYGQGFYLGQPAPLRRTRVAAG